ncbi:hypothetical protein [Subtercola vilae]|uniref:Uncharacterized protein n=1 Tax=Subtercola vilae TaxID=2056433 RepID=A0A4T2BBA6_9MICO|nr:hypothetical protein [Subtercola vilae]TIH26026.1 hypothetical protein D4765_19095 [Subtercola vilae]
MTNETERLNELGYFWDEALPEIVEQIDWSAITTDQWAVISNALNEHISNARDFMPPTPTSRDLYEMDEKPKRAALESEIERLRAENEAYRNSVMQRRGTSDVYVENGKVMYR